MGVLVEWDGIYPSLTTLLHYKFVNPKMEAYYIPLDSIPLHSTPLHSKSLIQTYPK